MPMPHRPCFAAWLTAIAVLTGSTACAAGGDDDTKVTPKSDASPDVASGDTSPTLDTGTPPPVDTGTLPPVDTGSPPPTDTDPGPCSTAVIDDMEGGEAGIKKICGRSGYWYTYNDGTSGGTQTPAPGASCVPADIPGGRAGSTKAQHTTGSGISTWGAGLAFDLANAGGTSSKTTYDASKYSGITFFAKASATLSLRVNLPTKGTDPLGGICTPSSKCSDHNGSTISVGTSWAPVTLLFKDMKQLGWGMPATFDPKTVYAVQFQVDKGVAFDFWIDDIAFVP